MSLHYSIVIRCNIEYSCAMTLNHSKKFNIKQFNIFKFDEVVIYTNAEMWYPQGIHIVSSSLGWPSIGIQGHCKYFLSK